MIKILCFDSYDTEIHKYMEISIYRFIIIRSILLQRFQRINWRYKDEYSATSSQFNAHIGSYWHGLFTDIIKFG